MNTPNAELTTAIVGAFGSVRARNEMKAQFHAVCAFFGVKPEELAGKDPAATVALFADRVAKAATEAQSPAVAAKGSVATTLTKAQFDQLTLQEKMSFSVGGGRIAG